MEKMLTQMEYAAARPLRLRKHAKILSTGAALPEESISNQDLIDEFDLMVTDRAVRYSIHQSVLSSCRIIAERLLSSIDMNIRDVIFFITSDQTRLVWKAQLDLLGLPETKSISCFHKYGNTVAGMVPLNLN